MATRFSRATAITILIWLAAMPCASFSQASHDKKKKEKAPPEKSVWNYDGGIRFQSDGDLPGGPCFRISGRVIAPEFFQDLKRFDYDDADTVFRRGKDTVTEFPGRLRLEFTIRDFPCTVKLDQFEAHRYLTRPEIERLGVTLYWKNGVDLNPAVQAEQPQFGVQARPGPAYAATEELTPRFEWFYVYDISGAGIPITDSLVVVMRTPSGNIVARFAARM